MKWFKICAFLLVFYFAGSCNKEKNVSVKQSIPEFQIHELKEYDKDYINGILESFIGGSNRAPEWLVRLRRWIRKHSGTHMFEHCQGSGECGPCPGICLNWGIIAGEDNGNEILSDSFYNLGYRLVSYALLEHVHTEEQKLMIEIVHNEDYIAGDRLYILDTMDFSQNLLTLMEKTQITILPGIYPIIYDQETNNGLTIFDAVLVD